MIPENSSLIVTNRNYHFHDVHNSSLATIYTHSICINTIYTHIFEIFTDQISSWLIAKRCTQPSKFICSSNHTTKSIAKLVFHTYYHEIHRDMDKNKWYWILACNRMVATTNSTPTLSAAWYTISSKQTAYNKVNPKRMRLPHIRKCDIIMTCNNRDEIDKIGAVDCYHFPLCNHRRRCSCCCYLLLFHEHPCQFESRARPQLNNKFSSSNDG